VRRNHHLVIGESNAERIKIEAGTAVTHANGRNVEIHIKGRDLREGRLKSVVLGAKDMAVALSGCIAELAEFVLRAIEDLPMAMAREVTERGVVLTGGGSLLEKLDVALTERVGVPFVLPQAPMHCVIKGTALVLESLNEREHLLIIP
jgi:rod shape-determining protein MreB